MYFLIGKNNMTNYWYFVFYFNFVYQKSSLKWRPLTFPWNDKVEFNHEMPILYADTSQKIHEGSTAPICNENAILTARN